MTEEQAMSVCEKFENGAKLTFYSYIESSKYKFNRHITGSASSKFKSFSTLSGGILGGDEEIIPIKSFVFECQVLMKADKDGFLKIVKLKKISEQELSLEYFKRSGTVRVINPDLTNKNTLGSEFNRNGTIYNSPSHSSKNNSPRFNNNSRRSSRSSIDSQAQLSEGVINYQETQPQLDHLQVPSQF
eukprot:CAMPEP_0114581602 /NCGR_PEP_ID=MMETSP0125-20121206/5689_1 /TAXON_ID=485358 ORGANISM="Aristerostoma sp., Strain ATCC 50986" /NCGR_SAMPLE_ID=MMETSP0125 /ASSEMBLY_ACC=CAM_ASM_000245 /LENGTH=186 /DNA_ID=CAMNT_0001773931 /DNA_START=245 /DNA_END=805 /DNA_ORIENTATION=+